MAKPNVVCTLLTLLFSLTLPLGALAEDNLDASPGSGNMSDPVEFTGVTGDWSGYRRDLVENGITFNMDLIQTYQGVTKGGTKRHFKYGGSLDYFLNLDFQKMGLWEGAFVDIFAETQFGESVIGDTGTINSVNYDAMLPYPDDHTTTLTQVVFTQYLSETFGLYFGKVCTIDGDSNPLSGGRGKENFMNMSLVFNPVSIRTVPYSTLGGGLIFLLPNDDGRDPGVITVSALGPDGQPSRVPWDDFDDGEVYSAASYFPTYFFDMPGNQAFGVNYSTKDYNLLRQDPRLILDWILGIPVTLETDDGSWAFYYNFHQFLYTEPQDESQGLGVFGRYGIADDKTNIVDSFYSVGVGGKGLFDERDNDTFGIGYFYTKTSSEFTDSVGSIPIIGPALASYIDDGEGFEIFYNIEVNPWCNITPDFQIIEPANTSVDTAYVVGVRAKVVF